LAGADGVPIVFMEDGAAAVWASGASVPHTIAVTASIPKINLVMRMTSILLLQKFDRLLQKFDRSTWKYSRAGAGGRVQENVQY